MFKFITRRLKETVDGTCYFVDSAKAWVCGVAQQQIPHNDVSNSYHDKQAGRFCENFKPHGLQCSFQEAFGKHIGFPKNFKIDEQCQKFSHTSSKGSSSSNSGKESGQKFREADQLRGDILGALTWSGAIMCGWYATQILCMQRRKFGWENTSQNRYIKYLQVSTRAVHTNVIDSYLVRATPILKPDIINSQFIEQIPKRERSPSISSKLTEEESIFESFYLKNLEDISFGKKANADSPKLDLLNNSSGDSGSTASSSSSRQSVSEAVNDLIDYIGDCENNMALEYIHIGDYKKAVTHLKLASNHHHPGGIFNLGVCYEKGLGVKKSLRRAMECYQVASGLGHPTAIFNLGVFYAQGLGGLKQDRNAAEKCITTAAKLGQPEAINFLNSIERENLNQASMVNKIQLKL
ncbi:uncharacterized protein LOC129609722 [Condylostylus longicornis]|uniref:uncharacterized protein LOC129609722 n=1 Tax=Condylostylus longicornis TaxID=2530218 RepID=UPI00244DD103|nr:uncharacterized protein LOC129609722 [Condylostylus longicornis]